MLLCKAHFVLEDFQSVVKCCSEAQADDLAVDLMSRRKAKMVAEALAYKGMVITEDPYAYSRKIKCECISSLILWA